MKRTAITGVIFGSLAILGLSVWVWLSHQQNTALKKNLSRLENNLKQVHQNLGEQLQKTTEQFTERLDVEIAQLESQDQLIQETVSDQGNSLASELKNVNQNLVDEMSHRVKTSELPFVLEDHKKDVIEKAQENVVYVVVEGGIGSGFFINDSGRVITNCHVVKDFEDVSLMTWDERWVSAVVEARDGASDLAVLQVIEEDLEYLRNKSFLPSGVVMANSDEVKVGDNVFAMGAPHGLTRTVNAGQVSNITRYLQGLPVLDRVSGLYNLYFQIDAGVMPGNSGGPSFNIHGEVIGVNTRANQNNESEGFVMPGNFVLDRVDGMLASKDKVNTYSTIGFDFQPYIKRLVEIGNRPKILPEEYDSAIQAGRIFTDSPAYKKGFRSGDLILEIDGEPIVLQDQGDVVAFRRQIAFGTPGKELAFKVLHSPKINRQTLEILEEGKEQEITLPVLAESTYRLPIPVRLLNCYINSVSKENAPKNYKVGVRFADFFNRTDVAIFRRMGGNVRGVPFLLEKGDIIAKVNGQIVKNPGDLIKRLAELTQERQVPNELTVLRRGKHIKLKPVNQRRVPAQPNVQAKPVKKKETKKSKPSAAPKVKKEKSEKKSKKESKEPVVF